MTKKHFKELADLLRTLQENHGDNIPAVLVITGVERICAQTNPNFDSGRFWAACEPRREDKR